MSNYDRFELIVVTVLVAVVFLFDLGGTIL